MFKYPFSNTEELNLDWFIESWKTFAENYEEQIGQLDLEILARLLANEYDPESDYSVGNYVVYDNYLWRNVVSISGGESWNANHWLQVLATDDLEAARSAITALQAAVNGMTTDDVINASDVDGDSATEALNELKSAISDVEDRFVYLASGDISDAVKSGIYFLGNAVTNKPTSNGGMYVVESPTDTTSGLYGIFVNRDAVPKVYFVRCINGTYTFTALADEYSVEQSRYYQPGDSITIPINTAARLLANNTGIYFAVQLDKPISSDVSTITVTVDTSVGRNFYSGTIELYNAIVNAGYGNSTIIPTNTTITVSSSSYDTGTLRLIATLATTLTATAASTGLTGVFEGVLNINFS